MHASSHVSLSAAAAAVVQSRCDLPPRPTCWNRMRSPLQHDDFACRAPSSCTPCHAAWSAASISVAVHRPCLHVDLCLGANGNRLLVGGLLLDAKKVPARDGREGRRWRHMSAVRAVRTHVQRSPSAGRLAGSASSKERRRLCALQHGRICALQSPGAARQSHGARRSRVGTEGSILEFCGHAKPAQGERNGFASCSESALPTVRRASLGFRARLGTTAHARGSSYHAAPPRRQPCPGTTAGLLGTPPDGEPQATACVPHQALHGCPLAAPRLTVRSWTPSGCCWSR